MFEEVRPMFHYLDNAATTPVRPEAAQAALEAMTEGWGNPSSQYALGKQAAGRMKGWREDSGLFPSSCIPIPGDLTALSGLLGYQEHTKYTHVQAKHSHTEDC